ncbi:hypothetical protein MVEN_00624700 [Mycena venus]|uniref:MACPF domain-containing protein n=1 Tax=Mycena venus TaxID=2733690 RepID=A0A8H6YQ12_9AGAR|nr:hypothetical protein MVEN_00624700 [Mycena venus]
MSELIIIMIGLRTAIETFAEATDREHSGSRQSEKRTTRIIRYYYPADTKNQAKPQRQATLREIETVVEKQLNKIRTANEVAGILFVHSNKQGETTGFPFESATRFLNLEGQALFRKLFLVVQSSLENVIKSQWTGLVNEGMRVAGFDGTHDSARAILNQLLGEAAQVPPVHEVSAKLGRSAYLKASESHNVSETPFLNSQPSSPPRRVQELADSYLGFTYNPILGTFGRSRVLSLDPLKELQFSSGPDSQVEQFTHVRDVRHEYELAACLLRCDFDIPDVAGLSVSYATSSTFKASWTSDSQLYMAQHVTATARVSTLTPRLSQEMIDLIEKLPPWSESSDNSKQQYNEFFRSHGTHVMLRLALGGNLRVIINDLQNVEDRGRRGGARAGAGAPALSRFFKIGIIGLCVRNHEGSDRRGRQYITILRDGGGAVAGELTRTLENHFKQCSPSSEAQHSWPGPEVREKWIQALEMKPTLIPDNKYTDYEWLYALGGLSEVQKDNLRLASQFYLTMGHKEMSPTEAPSNENPGGPVGEPRERNPLGVRQKIRKFFSSKKK